MCVFWVDYDKEDLLTLHSKNEDSKLRVKTAFSSFLDTFDMNSIYYLCEGDDSKLVVFEKDELIIRLDRFLFLDMNDYHNLSEWVVIVDSIDLLELVEDTIGIEYEKLSFFKKLFTSKSAFTYTDSEKWISPLLDLGAIVIEKESDAEGLLIHGHDDIYSLLKKHFSFSDVVDMSSLNKATSK